MIKLSHTRGISDIQVYYQPQKQTILQLQKYIFCWSSVDDKHAIWWGTKMTMDRESVSEQATLQSQQTPCRCALVGHAVFPETCCQDIREKMFFLKEKY